MAEKMSDADLRKELISYGEKSIGPITDSTRPLYLKKLNRLIAEKKKKHFSETRRTPPRNPSRKLVGFSSDESGDDQSNQQDNAKPRTVSGRTRPTRVSSRSTSQNSIAEPSVPLSTNIRPRRGLRPISNDNILTDKNKSVTASNSNQPSYRYSRQETSSPIVTQASSKTSSASIRNSDHKTTRSVAASRARSKGNLRKSEFSDSDHEEDDDEELDGLENGLDFTQPVVDDDDEDDEEEEEDDDSGPEMVSHSVNTSAHLDRSSFLNASGANSGYLLKPSQKSPLRLRSVGNTSITKVASKRYYDQAGIMDTDGFKAKERPTAYKLPHYISMCLVILAIMFFIFIAFIYLNMNDGPSRSQDMNRIVCKQKGDKDCIPEKKYASTYSMVESVSSSLTSQAGKHECGYSNDGRNVSLVKIKQQIKQKFGPGKTMKELEEDISAVLQLIVTNPQWLIKLYDIDSQETKVIDAVVSLESAIANKDVLCRLFQAVSNVFSTLAYLCLAALVVTIIVAIVRYKWRKQQEEKQQVLDLVEKIIEILKEHSENCQTDKDLDNYLAIPHVRDILIPLKDRKWKQKIWNKAVKFLSANESRVRVETQYVQGEEYEVWRWLQATATVNNGKVWQGQAFGESKDMKANIPNFTPLPCLKIRNMFNADTEYIQDWHIKVQDAILEKCGLEHGIVHIAVDQSSKEGCVYVKCNSRDAAGNCFSELHGWWFDGKLVTVKFLRPERYHDRFPDSKTCIRPLRPSNDSKASLSQPFHRSFLEKY